jgi:hypothetical protein
VLVNGSRFCVGNCTPACPGGHHGAEKALSVGVQIFQQGRQAVAVAAMGGNHGMKNKSQSFNLDFGFDDTVRLIVQTVRRERL